MNKRIYRRLLVLPTAVLLSGFSLEGERQKRPGLALENQGAFIQIDTKKPEKLPLVHKARTPAGAAGEPGASGIARSDQDDPQDKATAGAGRLAEGQLPEGAESSSLQSGRNVDRTALIELQLDALNVQLL